MPVVLDHATSSTEGVARPGEAYGARGDGCHEDGRLSHRSSFRLHRLRA
jgi:hypothetical protein